MPPRWPCGDTAKHVSRRTAELDAASTATGLFGDFGHASADKSGELKPYLTSNLRIMRTCRVRQAGSALSCNGCQLVCRTQRDEIPYALGHGTSERDVQQALIGAAIENQSSRKRVIGEARPKVRSGRSMAPTATTPNATWMETTLRDLAASHRLRDSPSCVSRLPTMARWCAYATRVTEVAGALQSSNARDLQLRPRGEWVSFRSPRRPSGARAFFGV